MHYNTLTSVVYVRTTQRLIWNLVSNYIGFTLRVNPWLWNWAQVTLEYQI